MIRGLVSDALETNFIESCKTEVEIKILQSRLERSFRRRPRNPEEIKV